MARRSGGRRSGNRNSGGGGDNKPIHRVVAYLETGESVPVSGIWASEKGGCIGTGKLKGDALEDLADALDEAAEAGQEVRIVLFEADDNSNKGSGRRGRGSGSGKRDDGPENNDIGNRKGDDDLPF